MRSQCSRELEVALDVYRVLYQNADDAILVIDDGVFATCNSSWERLFGTPVSELVGHSLADPPQSAHSDAALFEEIRRERIGAVLAGQPQRFEWTQCRAGSSVHTEVSIERLEMERRSYLLVVIRDITRPKRTEAALERERLLNTTIVDAVPEAFFIYNEHQRGVYANQVTLSAFGTTLEDFRNFSPLDRVHPDDVELVRTKIAEVFETGCATCEARYLSDAGVLNWRYLSARRMTVDGQRLLVGTAVNITEQKITQAKLAQALAEVTLLRDRLRDENVYLREQVKRIAAAGPIIKQSPALRAVLEQVERVAATDSTVLLLGETGSGKELFANAIHERSARRERPMIRVNCAALPSTLLESELFGREKGAYTGALTRQVGRFELASGSSIFLDEIGELPLDAQAKLLRVLQERQIERLGNPTPIAVDVRIIAATNRDLAAEVQAGRFRQDLYFRLSVFPLVIPPLRARTEDIPALVWSFVAELSAAMGKRIELIPDAEMTAARAYSWPGNIRELRNVVERSLIMATGTTMSLQLPTDVGSRSQNGNATDRDHITQVLQRCGWRIRGEAGAAALLGLKPTTLEARMKRLGIHRPT